MTLLNLLIITLVVQQVLDVWTTKKALDTGKAKEANGPLRRLMDSVGVMPALLLTKCIFVPMVLMLADATIAWYIVLGSLVALYTWVLANNFRVLKKIGAL